MAYTTHIREFLKECNEYCEINQARITFFRMILDADLNKDPQAATSLFYLVTKILKSKIPLSKLAVMKMMMIW